MPNKIGNGRVDKLIVLIEEARADGYPQALQIRVHHKGRVVVDGKFGPAYKFWDVGSLTKIVVTTPLIMKLYEEDRIDLHSPVARSLPFLEGTACGKILIEDLLSHASGLEWWRPFFKDLSRTPIDERDLALRRKFQKEKVKGAKKCVYSDLDFILLGWLVEEKYGMPLDEAAQVHLFQPWGLKNTFFLKNGDKLPGFKKQFAPTERHASRGLLQGVVFDDNAWSVGGVSGHAGLFSTLDDLSQIGLHFWRASRGGQAGQVLLRKRKGGSSRMIGNGRDPWTPKTFSKFTTRFTPKSWGDWGLGFSIPSRPVSTAGKNVSSDAFGHTGYPGTSLWVDRRRDTVVTILANRTFPTRKDERFLQLRRDLHDCIWEMIDDIRE